MFGGERTCSSTDTHDEDTSTASGVAAEVGGSDGEDAGVHGSHEEEDDDDAGNTGCAPGIRDVGRESDADRGVYHEDKVGFQEVGDTSGDEAADGENDETVRQQLSGLFRSVRSRLGGVVDEESGNGNLGTDVGKLGDKSEDHVEFLVDGLLLDDVAILIQRKAELFRVAGDDGTSASSGF